jgi:DNA (cytosine-5)-methyltransferase 1
VAVYYNEIEPFAAAWLRELMSKGLLPEGEVDERSIVDVRADDLRGFRQCHFFAGIGGWPYALRLAGFDDDREVWTGSCPCQPFSSAGKQKGADDERHLWPAFYRLIAERRPAIIFGEQVAGSLGHQWLAGVRADLEDAGYACGAADLCAAGVSAPHIRRRLYWCAVADADVQYREKPDSRSQGRQQPSFWDYASRSGVFTEEGDGKLRRIKPGAGLLADGIPNRMGRLRGFGNAIVPQVAAEFISAVMEAI